MAESEPHPICISYSEDIFDAINLVIRCVLGSGMSGDVVLAQGAHTPSFMTVLKAISLFDKECEARKRELFDTEVRVMKLLEHPHLMKGKLAATCPKRLYIMMEYYPRGSLEKGLSNLTFPQIEQYLVQLASAVKYMHNKRIVHCDIKLPNILVKSDSDVTLTDFGLSICLPDGVDRLPIRNIGGTPIYMSPERRNVDPYLEIDPKKADVYALGVSLWGMVFRKDPERGCYDFLEVIQQSTEVPTLLRLCLLNMLETNPNKRFSSEDLMEFLKNQTQCRDLIGLLPM